MSLRTRLTVSYVSFFALALIVLDIGLYLIVRKALLDSVNNELQNGAQIIQQNFTSSNETLQTIINSNRTLQVLFGNTLDASLSVRDFSATNLWVQVYGRQPNEKFVAQSSNLAGLSPGLQQEVSIDPDVIQDVLNDHSIFRIRPLGKVRIAEMVVPLRF